MLKLNKIGAGGRGLAPVLVKRAAQGSLDWAAHGHATEPPQPA